MQAKDVADADFLAVVDRCRRDGRWGTPTRWVLRYEVEEAFPSVPWKVLLAKARSLMKRKLMTGCACGCRGDYEITALGEQALADGKAGYPVTEEKQL